MPALNPFEQAALRLRNASPQAFEDFKAMYDRRFAELCVKIAHSPAHEIMIIQGQAQECEAIIRILKECTIERPTKPTPQASPQ
jgi:hypothetical protein